MHQKKKEKQMRHTILSSGFIGRLVIVALSATLAATLAVAAFTSTDAAQATETETANVVQGKDSDGGFVERAFPSKGIPLLKGFQFFFGRKAGWCGEFCATEDFNLADIRIEPRVTGVAPIRKSLRLGFADERYDDGYYYDVQHYLLYDPSIRLYDTGINEGVGHATKTISRPAPPSNYEFVLRGFQLQFREGLEIKDHRIDEVGIIENNGKVTVDFNDGNKDDHFLYRIWYAYVPKAEFSRLGEASGTFAREFGHQDIRPGRAVIRGFRFAFKPTCQGSISCFEHQISAISVRNNGSGKVSVWYADKNGDDPFEWRVKWGTLNGAFPDQPVAPTQ